MGFGSGGSVVGVSEQAGAAPGESVKTEVFRSEEADGSIVTKTVRTTTRTVKSSTGELVTTIEVETTTETESTDGTTSTTVAMETREETETEESSLTTTSASDATAVSVSEQAGAAPGESVKTEVFRSEEADGSIVTKTVRTTTRTVKSSTGELVTTIEVETTTETESTDGTTSTTVAMETREETETEESSLTTTSASDATAVSVSEQAGAAPGESVKTEVFRSEEADGSIVTKTVRTTTRTVKSSTGELVTTIEVETTTETESTDGTTSTTVAMETREETETEESSLTTTSASDATAVSVSEQAGAAPGESVKTEVFRSEEADGSIVTKTVRTTTRTVKSSTGELVTTIEVETTTETESTDGTTSTTVAMETRDETDESTTSSIGAVDFKSGNTQDAHSTEDSDVGAHENSTVNQIGSGGIISPTSSSLNGEVELASSKGDDSMSVHSVSTKKVKKSKQKVEDASASLTSDETERTQSTRVAAAWGEEAARSSTEHTSESMQMLMVRSRHSLRLAFDDLVCVNEISKESIDAVEGVTGYAESGMLTAVIGAGRVGKAAFLGALAGETNQTKGKVYYNGSEASSLVRRRATGYCWFGDNHAVWHGTTTVREAMCISASLRQVTAISESCKQETVESWLALLGITELAARQIDSCSTVETRLVAIGVELAFEPGVLLVDEPTSGLDSKGAQRVIHVLQQVARTGRTVVCSLGDSVSSIELRVFSRLLLLSSNGEVLFHGESRSMVQYLEGLPGVKKLSSGKNIIEWALESVGEGSIISQATTAITTTRAGKVRTSRKKKKYASASSMSTGSDTVNREKEMRFVQLFQRSEVKRTLLTQMQRVGYLRPDSAEEHTPALITAFKSEELAAYATSWRTQVVWLTRRVVLSYWRSLSSTVTIRSLMMTSAVTTQWQRFSVMGLFLTVFMRLLWLFVAARSSEYDTFDGVNHGVSLIAWSTLMLGASFALGAIMRASRGNARRENACWRREQAWQAYPAVMYHVCSSVVELLFVLTITFVAAVFTFTLFGFWSVAESGNFTLYWLTLSIFALGQVYLGQWLVRLAPSESIAAAAGAGINFLPLLMFVWYWRGSALGNLTWLLVFLTPQRLALQVLQALVFGSTADSCIYDIEGIDAVAESQLPCRELRLIPSESYSTEQQQLTVHSYAELEYGAERSSVALRLIELGVFLAVFRFLVVVALQKRPEA
ncbi:hypothetical protein PRNP1_010306 [Phytophthora ramorum]